MRSRPGLVPRPWHRAVHSLWTKVWRPRRSSIARRDPREQWTTSVAGHGVRRQQVHRQHQRSRRATWTQSSRTSSRAWRAVVDDLQPNQRAWLRASEPVTLHESTAIIAVADEFTRSQLEGRLRGQLEDALTVGFGRDIRLARHGQPARSATDRAGATRPSRPRSTRRLSRQVDASPHATSRRVDRRTAWPTPASRPPRSSALETRLNPKYTFETFVIGSSNRFPHAAAVAVAEAPGQGVQPAAGLRRLRPGQDPPAARDRALRPQPLHRRQGALRVERGVHQRVHQRDPRRPAGPVQAALPRRRRAADRRHPVPGGQDPDPGGVLPHLQHAAQRQQADRDHLRPAAQAARGARGPAAQPVRVGPDHRRPAARPRDPDRDPAQEGRDRPAHRAAGRAGVHRLARSRPTSASSRVR